MSLNELKAELTAKKDQAKAILDSAKAMDRDLYDDELAKVEALTDEADGIKAQLDEEQGKRDRAAAQAKKLAELDAKAEAAPKTLDNTVATTVIESIKDLREDDPNAGFKTPRDFLNAVMRDGMGVAHDERLTPLAAVGSDENRGNSNPLGGFLIPEGFSPNLLSTGYEGGDVLSRLTRVPMENTVVNIPARVDKDHSNGVTGGFKFYRRNQASDIESTKGEFENVKLEANSMAGLAYATNELMTDSPISFASIIQQSFTAEAESLLMGELINGTGVGEMEGLLVSPAKIEVAKETGQDDDTIVGENIAKMWARAWRFDNAVWLANQTVKSQLPGMHIAGTNGDQPIFTPSLSEGMPATLMGRPIIFTEDCPALGDAGDLILFNPSQYLFGEYQMMEGATSMHVRFVSNEMAFRVTARNDGKCWWRSALTPKNGDTLSPIVTLAARA